MDQQHLLHQTFLLQDGRALGFAEYGLPDGQPVFYFHGFPACRLEAAILAIPAEQLNVRVIAVDRPGYGLSDKKLHRRVSDWPLDIEQLADHLKLQEFSILGVSGGGPYALACAYFLQQRIKALSLVGCLGPVYQRWAVFSMNYPARVGFMLGRHAPMMLPIFFGGLTAKILRRQPKALRYIMTLARPQPDREVLGENDVRHSLQLSLREALRPGAQGALSEFEALASDWGFDLSKIEIPVDLWQGGIDRVVPLVHADFYINNLPLVRPRIFAEDGHFSLPIKRMQDILTSLVNI